MRNSYEFKVCTCEYDGTNYCGWQFQENSVSVQQVIEKALSSLYKEPIRILGSGRTDAGVHAHGQVFSFRAGRKRDDSSIIMGANSLLPSDICILDSQDAPANFHPIASAKSKTYLYRILNRKARGALELNKAWHYWQPLDFNRIADILSVLEGEHDFSSFCMIKSLKHDNVRKINFTKVSIQGDIISIRVNANGFLHNMMRIIVGTVVSLSFSESGCSDMLKILNYRQRDAKFKTAPACGLYLEKVFY